MKVLVAQGSSSYLSIQSLATSALFSLAPQPCHSGCRVFRIPFSTKRNIFITSNNARYFEQIEKTLALRLLKVPEGLKQW